MAVNLAGANVTETFSTTGITADANAPYTNTGGANASATLSLTATAIGVEVTEAAGAISGAGNAIALQINGPGEVALLGANGYTGGTLINGAELSIASMGALGTGSLTFGPVPQMFGSSYAILESSVTGTLTNAFQINMGDTPTIEAATGTTLTLANSSLGVGDSGGTDVHFGSASDVGAVVLAPTVGSGDNTGSAVTIDGGMLALGTAGGAFDIDSMSGVTVGSATTLATFNIGGHSVTAHNLNGSSSGVVTNSGAAATLTVDNTFSSTFAGVIRSGAGVLALEVSGAGGTSLTLTGANIYTGGTTIDSGQTLQLGNGGTTGSILGAVTDNGALLVDRSNGLTLTGAISGAGTVTQSGGGKLTLTGANSYSGGATIEGGEISIGSANALGTGTLTFATTGATLESTITGSVANALRISAGVSATIEAAAGTTLTLTGASDTFAEGAGATLRFGSATDTGSVVLALGSPLSVTSGAGAAIDGGTLKLGGVAGSAVIGGASGGLTVGSGAASATLDVDGHGIVAYNLTGSAGGVVTNSGAAATFKVSNASSTTFAGVIRDGAGALALGVGGSGNTSLTLTGANTYSGGTTINAKQSLYLGDGGSTGSIAGAVTDNGQLVVDRDNAITLAGAISGSGTLTQKGSGSLNLTGANSYAGGTVIAGGTLSIGNASALGAGATTFAGKGVTLQATVTATLTNSINIDSGDSLTIGATAGHALTLASTGDDILEGGTGTTLHFGSSVDTGVVDLAPEASASVSVGSDVSIDGGSLVLGGSEATLLFFTFYAKLTVGSGATSATLDVAGYAMTAKDLTGTSAGIITNSGAATTLTCANSDDSTFSGLIENGGGALSLAKTDNATLTLTGANTFSGGITIDGGSLALGKNTSAGTGEISFGANAYATLILAAGVDPGNTISMPDATDAIDLSGIAFSPADHLVLLSSGVTSTYELETGTGAFLESLKLTGAFPASTLLVGVDGDGGTELEAAYTAAQAANQEGQIVASGQRIFISDTAANIAANASAVSALIADDSVASVFSSGASLSDGASLALDVFGTDDSVSFANATGDSVNLFAQGGAEDSVNGSNGAVQLDDTQAAIYGGDDTVTFLGSTGDIANLFDSDGEWDSVSGSSGVVNLSDARASVFGGDDIVRFVGDPGDAVSLYDTAGMWDSVAGDEGTIYLTNARASVSGGSDSVVFAGGSGNAVSLYATNQMWDAVTGSNGVIYLTSAQVSVAGGADSVLFAGGSGNAASLYSTNQNWDGVTGSNGYVYLTSAQASVSGQNDSINFHGGADDAVSLYDTNQIADAVTGSNGLVYLTSAQASVSGYSNTTVFAGGAGNVVSLLGTSNGGQDAYDAVNGSNGLISLTSAQVNVTGSLDTIDFHAGVGDADRASLYDTQGVWDTVNGSNGFVYLTSAQASVIGGDDTIGFSGGSGNIVSISGNDDVINGSSGEIDLYDATAKVVGSGETMRLFESDTLNLTDAPGSNLLAFTSGVGGQDRITGFESADVLQFSKTEFANYAAISGHVSSSSGNAVITIDASDSITLVGVAASSLTSAQFAFV
jgi:autotransporter-associated beta strand protein